MSAPLLPRERPEAIDAEQAALSACMWSSKAVAKVFSELACEDFYNGGHQAIYRGIEALAKANATVDLTTLTETMKRQGTLEGIGGRPYLLKLYNTLQTAALLDHYIKPIKDAAKRRMMIDTIDSMLADVYDKDRPATEIAEDFVVVFQTFSSEKDNGESRSARTVFSEQRAELLARTAPAIIPLHQPDLDAVLHVHPGDLVVVAGIFNTGKSATMLNWLLSAAQAEVPCELYTLEMTERECRDRMLGAKSGIPVTRIAKREYSDSELEFMTEWTVWLESLPIRFTDSGIPNIEALRSRLRSSVRQHGTKLVFVDQLRQLNTRAKIENETLKLGYVAQQLKQAAMENGIGIVLLHQLNRGSEAVQRPEVQHLRGSGMIAEDCDAVVLLYQPERKKEHAKGAYGDEVPLEWIIGRQRNGPKGVVKRTFRLSTQRIYEWSEQFDEDDTLSRKDLQ